MNYYSDTVAHYVDVCVVGGGMSGTIAAISAARHGSKVLLMQDRPMLGGNASSEVRMWIRGASGMENRETGVLQEIEFENIWRNPTLNFNVWDSVIYGKVKDEKNIELLLNTSCLGAEVDGDRIVKIRGWELNSYTFHEVYADIFIDASGDGVLAPLTGAEFRVGRESSAEFGEKAAVGEGDSHTMGSSVLFQARETDHYCLFTPPDWAYVYPDDESMHLHTHIMGPSGTNFWWIEYGGDLDTIKDAGKINDELLKIVYGVWDHLKNHGDHHYENWELDWVGFYPGKRESRRYVGPYTLKFQDLSGGTEFPDAVAFGGWTMDDHSPLGFYHHGYTSHHYTVKVPYQIPLSSLYSRNIKNLMFAGRDISATHMALSSTRVMATCSLIGQAVGTAAALAIFKKCSLDDVDKVYIKDLQKTLLDDGAWIPGKKRVNSVVPESLDQSRISILVNGWERPQGSNGNSIEISEDEVIVLAPKGEGREYLRLSSDTDFSRESITDVEAYKKFAMRSHIAKDFKRLKLPKNLMRSCLITQTYNDGREEELEIKENRRPVFEIEIPQGVKKVTIKKMISWSSSPVALFSADIYRREWA